MPMHPEMDIIEATFGVGEDMAIKVSGPRKGIAIMAVLVEEANLIHRLCVDEGDCVTIYSANPDAETDAQNYAVDVNGLWTHWEDKRFSGKTNLAALRLAVAEKERPR